MWQACWVRLFLTRTKRLKIHAASPSPFLFSVSLQSQFADLISPFEYVYPVVGELHSSPPSSHLSPPTSPPSVHLSTLIPLPISRFLQQLHHFVSLFVPLPSSSLACFVHHHLLFQSWRWVNSCRICSNVLDATEPWGKPTWRFFFCGQNCNSGIIFFQSETKQRSSYKHAADRRENKYSPECVSIVYRALFQSVLWWKSGVLSCSVVQGNTLHTASHTCSYTCSHWGSHCCAPVHRDCCRGVKEGRKNKRGSIFSSSPAMQTMMSFFIISIWFFTNRLNR